ncbi:hypothetical protein [Kordia sp.]|uniref:hypothetical protein n=1 Tax=Kordia sp. TaxID=1965332 RepID=UPI003D6C2A36
MKTKKYSIIPLLIAVLGMLSACSNKSDRSMFGVKGKVKNYIEKNYHVEMNSGEWKKGEVTRYGNTRVSFDRNGNYESIEFLNEDNSVSQKIVPVRKDGKIVKENRYDENGEKVGDSEIGNQSETEITYSSYDEDGKKISMGKTYLENDRAVRREIFMEGSGDTQEEIIIEFEYDENGNISSTKQTDRKGKIMSDNVFKYTKFDEHNNWTERLEYSKENSDTPQKIVHRTYEYHE